MRRLVLTALLSALVLAGAGAARGELAQQGKLRLAFSGRFAPHSLPRDGVAPVTVSLAGSVTSIGGGPPPPLRRISIAVNRHGRFFTRGLPVCVPSQLEQTSTRVALARCRGALVGRGRFDANIDVPTATPLPVEGKMLAFNSRVRRRRAILMHIHGTQPVRATFVLTFFVTHPRRGAFGTVLTARIPRLASDLGYITDISMSFGRRYAYAGRRRSFLSASCAAPPGFPGGTFTFLRGSFSFAGGQRLTTALVRDCRVR
jgi:hypothetical protein